MSISPSTASSRRLSQEISNYETLFQRQSRDYPKWRIEKNTQKLKALQKQINTTIKGSYSFTSGKQLQDEGYKELFIDFFREMRGGDYLVNQSGWNLAKALCYGDTTRVEEFWVDGGEYDDYLSRNLYPTEEFNQELWELLDLCEGFNEQFLKTLKVNSKQFIQGLSLKTRDTYISSIPIFSRVFPRCYETLQSIFSDLLSSEWLQEDIYGIQEYTSQKISIDHSLSWDFEDETLWNSSKIAGQWQRNRDKQLAKKHEDAWKNDKYGMLVSGALSYGTGNPIFIGGQLVRAITNSIARNNDPEGKNLLMQALPTLANTGMGIIDGPSKALLASLTFDLADLYHRKKEKESGIELSKKEEAGRNVLMTFGKALLTGSIHGNDEKYLRDILGGLASEALNQLPETDENTTEGARLLRAIATNPDIQGQLIDKAFKKPLPEIKELPNEDEPIHQEKQVEEVKERFDDQWLEDVFNDSLYQSKKELKAPQEVIQQEVNQITKQISQVDEVIKVGTEHLNNLEISGERVDIAQYEVIKKSGDWRLYRNGIEVYCYAQGGCVSESKSKKRCYKMIPTLQKEYGSSIHTQEYKKATKALDRAKSEKSGLLENLGNLQLLLVPYETREQYARNRIEYNKQLETQKQRDVEGQRLNDELIQKNAGVLEAYNHLDDKACEYNRHYKKEEYYSKLKGSVKNVNTAIQERDAIANQIYAFNIDPTSVNTPLEKIPKRASKWEKTKMWIDRNVEININLSTSMPLYQMKEPKSTDYYMPVDLDRPTQHQSNWNEVQSFQNQRMLQENMSFKSAKQAQGTTQHEISQYSADMGLHWGSGVARNVQRPITNAQDAIQSGQRTPIATTRHNPIEMAGFAPFVLSKVIPKQTQEKVKTWVKDYIREIKNDPIQARKDLDVAVILGAKKAVVIAIQAFEQPSLKERPNTYGLMEASDRFDRWATGKINVNLDSKNARLGMFIGEFFAPMGMAKTARPVMKVGQEAIHFLRSTRKAQPLIDRVLVRPQGFSKQLRAIEAFQKPVYRSGFVGNHWSEMFPTQPKKITGRSVAQIKPKMIQAGKGINRSNNHQFVTWIEKGETKAVSIGEMSHAGTFHDRSGLTKAGRALDKKASRVGSVFPKPKGTPHEINVQGQMVLDEILNHPDKKVIFPDYLSKKFGFDVVDIVVPKKGGARFTRDGKIMIGFLEP